MGSGGQQEQTCVSSSSSCSSSSLNVSAKTFGTVTTRTVGNVTWTVTDGYTRLHVHPCRSNTWRWWLGLFQASLFSMIYFVAPSYMLSVVGLFVYYYCTMTTMSSPLWLWWYSAPLILSALLPPMVSPFCIQCFRPMLDYFDSFEMIYETSPINTYDEITSGRRNYILAFTPHGVVSYTGILSAVAADAQFQGRLPTAVANAVLYTPILKHFFGIFNLISASKTSLLRTVKNNHNHKGLEGSVVLYVGGMAELFLSCENQERLYLKKRKGFIKLSLQTGVDIIPVYLFGNTSVLSVYKAPFLSHLSRKLQLSLTYIWGKWYLPIPRNDCKLLYVSGQPLNLPHIPNPTVEDIDKYHALYCQEITRLYNKYREKIPDHKHKPLQIL